MDRAQKDIYVYGYLICNKGASAIQWREDYFLINGAGESGS